MNNVVEFCYICFDCSKNLKDLLKSEEECLELMAKLRVCVSEVNWSTYKKLLICEKCIKKLNKSHEFKKQCIQCSETLKLYLSELEKTKEKQVEKREAPLVLHYLNLMKDDKSVKKPPMLPLKTTPDPQMYPAITKIILTNQPNTFQNVFLNLLPQNIVKSKLEVNKIPQPYTINVPPLVQVSSTKGGIKLAKKNEDEDVSKLLVESKTEELSVECDPLDFNMDQEKVENKPLQLANNNFRPILPKIEKDSYDYTNEEKMEFFGSGHFLLQDFEKSNRSFCEKCLVRFQSPRMLHNHIKQVHNSEYPYRCNMCGTEFAAKEVYKSHMNRHAIESSELLSNSITLTDFANNSPKINDLLQTQQLQQMQQIPEQLQPQIILNESYESKMSDIEEVKCDECGRIFASTQGLIRHKSKLHKTYKRKKYFIKGMKNAKCDICNRMFSTQSYMQLHRKLHDRKGEWRRKIYRHDQATEKSAPDDELENTENDAEEEEVKRKIPRVKSAPFPSATAEKDRRNDLKVNNGKDSSSKCTFCSESFCGERDLQRHIDKVHIKTSFYKCQYCNGTFKEGFLLTKHLLTHCSTSCMECGEKYSCTFRLKDHIQGEHDGSAHGQCSLCDEHFGSVEELRSHVNKHLKVYKCHLCGNEFDKCLELTRHLVGHNSGNINENLSAIKDETSD